ncbi:site-specific integrase [Mucilaginibacter sp. RCC_168]|uniref:site-specific integrase n=1 Tax=Mucilaginibacter sp. RCC_168 TaxID=3239221 RepID=UPI003524DB97
MLEKTFGLHFFLKQSQNQNDDMFIYLKITVDGQSKEMSTKRKCEAAKWNSQTGRAIGNKESIKELNNFLEVLDHKVYQAKRQLIESNKEVSAKAIKDILTGNYDKRRTILEIFRHHNDQMKALEGKDYARGTIGRYEISFGHTKAFMKWQYGSDEDIDIRNLDHEFISQYSFWLKTVRNCNHNSTVKYLANFKKIVLICVKNGWLPADPFAKFKMTKKKVERTALTEAELRKLEMKDFDNSRLDAVRDIFIFSCYTGLAYVDVQKLKRSDIRYGQDKKFWLFVVRQKTSAPSRIPLLLPAQQILVKYRDHPKCSDTGMALPVLTNQCMNTYLKEIAGCCGIKTELTFHIARHTFATTVTLNNGVPIETVSKMLGHADIKQTQHYAKMQDYKVSKDMLLLEESLLERGRLGQQEPEEDIELPVQIY